MTSASENLQASFQKRSARLAEDVGVLETMKEDHVQRVKELEARLESAKSDPVSERILRMQIGTQNAFVTNLILAIGFTRELGVLWDIQAVQMTYVDSIVERSTDEMLNEIRASKNQAISELAKKYDVSHEGILRHLKAVEERRQGGGLEGADKKDE
jgi:hypothetical protein